MATKDDDTAKKTEVDGKDTAPTEQPARDDVRHERVVRSTPPWPLITVGVFATVLLLAVVAIGWLQLASLHKANHTAPTYGATSSPQYGYGGGMRGGNGGVRGGFSRGIASGVVTAINGDTITVSGSGKQVTVKKTSSTTINGDESDIAVNDSVVIFGTKADDGTITATRITVRNNGVLDGASVNGGSGTDTPPSA